MARLPASVLRGAELLDERLPGWPHHVDADKLDLGNSCNCPLGQIFGDYDDAVDILGLEKPERFGFHLAAGRQTFDKLTDAWRRVVLQRQAT